MASVFDACPSSLPCGVHRPTHEIIPTDLTPTERELLDLEPPAEVVSLHSAAHLVSFARHLKEIIDQPVHRAEALDSVFYSILGCAVFCKQADGTFVTARWIGGKLGTTPVLIEFDPIETPIVDLPRTTLWHEMLRDGFLEEAWLRLGGTEPAARWAAWAWPELERRLIRTIDPRRLRSRIRAGLELDWRTVSVLRTIERTDGLGRPSVTHYNLIRSDIKTLAELHEISPLLAVLWFYLDRYGGVDSGGETMQQLKRVCRDLGIKPAQWRLLVKSGAPLLTAFRIFLTEFVASTGPNRSVDFLRTLAVLEPTRMHDPDLWRSVFSMAGTRNRAPESYATALATVGKALRHIVALIERGEATADLVQRRSELHAICAWIADLKVKQFDVRQRRRGWAFLVAKANGYASQRKRALELEAVNWRAPCLPVTVGDFTAVPLVCGRDLWEESVAMRHCADRFAQRCLERKTAIFSVRRSDDTRYATLALDAGDEGWHLRQVSGPANQRVGPELDELIALTTATLDAMAHLSTDVACEAQYRLRILANGHPHQYRIGGLFDTADDAIAAAELVCRTTLPSFDAAGQFLWKLYGEWPTIEALNDACPVDFNAGEYVSNLCLTDTNLSLGSK